MKNLLFLIVIAAIVSCQAPVDNNSQLDGFKTNQASADAAFNLFENGSLEEMGEMYADDMFWSPPNTTDSLSKDEWQNGGKEWHANFENFSFDDRLYYPSVDDDFVPNGGVRVYGTWTGESNETGNSFSVDSYHYFDIQDGQIIASGDYFDATGMVIAVSAQKEEEE